MVRTAMVSARDEFANFLRTQSINFFFHDPHFGGTRLPHDYCDGLAIGPVAHLSLAYLHDVRQAHAGDGRVFVGYERHIFRRRGADQSAQHANSGEHCPRQSLPTLADGGHLKIVLEMDATLNG